MTHRLYVRPDEYDYARIVVPFEEATLVTSLTDKGTHAPVIDIDYNARLVPSSTEGHFHLYLDREVSWFRYRRVLKALYKAGLIQRGVYRHAKARRATYGRLFDKTVPLTEVPADTRRSFSSSDERILPAPVYNPADYQ